ncbi:MAG: putative zinc-binding peptidase [Propionibacteriaceae bacterium]|nr:putative zinc-binding peptidase [Propionibacteriaceae bacterium]
MLRCPRCRCVADLDALTCTACDLALGFHPPTLTMMQSPPDGVRLGEQRWRPCANRERLDCNWLSGSDVETEECFACDVVRRRPDADEESAWRKLAEASIPKRRLLTQLAVLGLPVATFRDEAGGLAFDLISSRSSGEDVTIGHASGVITIDLVESLDEVREQNRIRLGEPYRTMLGHFRHEAGHYYQWKLVEQTARIDACRELFGDERASYADALDRHYEEGAPQGWEEAHISEYATMHPWEDFAETFAHYLHITDTLTTVALGGVVLKAERSDGVLERDVLPRATYVDARIEDVLDDWHWLSLLLNRASRAMGRSHLYPFTIAEPVVAKLAFVHEVLTAVGRDTPRPILR